jgi:adenylate cyclase
MQLSSTLAWLVDKAGASPDADRFLAELGARLIEDALPLAGGALTIAAPHPIIASRTWLWRADTGAVIEALGFATAGLPGARPAGQPGDAGRGWLEGVGGGPVHEDGVGLGSDGPSLGWIGPRPFTSVETDQLRQVARFAAAPLAALIARATLTATLEAYLGRRSAARVLAGPLCGAASARPSGLRCCAPICAGSPPCPRSRRRRR